MILVTGIFRIPRENLDAIRPMMLNVIEASCSEDGCLAYSYAADVVETGLFRVFEAWRDRETLDRHIASDHMRIWAEERDKLGFFGRDISVHDVSETIKF